MEMEFDAFVFGLSPNSPCGERHSPEQLGRFMLPGYFKQKLTQLSGFTKKKWLVATIGVLLSWQAIAMLIGETDHQHRIILEQSGATVQRGPSYGPLDFISGLSDGLGAVEGVNFSDVTLNNLETGSLAKLRFCHWVGFSGCTFSDPAMAISDLCQMESLETIFLSNLDGLDLLMELMAQQQSKINSLMLDKVNVTDRIIKAISQFPNLRTLSIRESNVPSGGISRLKQSNLKLIVHEEKRRQPVHFER